ncbi:TetR/AcrR family transcriptional regulator [Pantoea sp. Acro-805]|uniref:TetR/AcrR family transcriptional regulator n=1 Tax=Candidatus Pantoea formicae TaxID=2608355 RepID=A0ABX0QRW3_9GAMM|nr:TetR/AcrR family transcriptional regulator [Pantoea formicae]MDF7647779.1 TetR/AcrR family transcriptional regulator [Erwiniaceae bacterium L1_54_3]NIE99115.1 TetR/AcrR family transcriptional regulator [Pantoea formicae]
MKETTAELREKILDTAVALFIEKGLENVKTRELTTQLGLSRSHIYHYFPDWATLCLEACGRFAQRDLQVFTRDIEQLPFTERLEAFISSYLPQEPDAVWQLYSSLWRKATTEAAYAQLATQLTQHWQALMAGIIEDGISTGAFREANAQQVARQLSAMLNGYADLLIVVQQTEAREQAINDLRAFIKLAL